MTKQGGMNIRSALYTKADSLMIKRKTFELIVSENNPQTNLN
jgi:hypothetical protein